MVSLNTKPDKRGVYKTVSVTIDVTPEDVADTLTRAEVVQLCARHNILLKGSGGRGGGRHKIDRNDLEDVLDQLRRGHIDDALIGLERVLPSEFRHLSEDVASYFAKRR